ncbi:hypothetical protein [Cellvibrio fibrivorans]|uniref:Uncharacterized protein (DUF1330 family) n=1 Tax=Cellvibrio fibrivorans TaxID=126350 RepID=A0ABU1UTU6_9GAMM|nr:hypothetical protein [Cellvibrio fibrivorans]MDR7088567.1 uncharacterized protein (DUF1330 family) [Cellvibrio fibrivorans]
MKKLLSSSLLSASLLLTTLSPLAADQEALDIHIKYLDLASEISLKPIAPMSELQIPQVMIRPAPATASLTALNLNATASQSDLDKLSSGVVIAVAAKLKQGRGLSDQLDFKSLEAPIIRKHNGTVIVSAGLADSTDSPFDILEVIHFPNQESFERLMNDEAYAPGKKLGDLMSKTYEKDVAIAQVAVVGEN